ncbi:MAG: GNA1162 family protein [Syntrophales bacterium]
MKEAMPYHKNRRILKYYLFILILLTCLLSGCAKKIPHFITPEFEKKGIRLVAVLPVSNQSKNLEAASLFRGKVLEAIYFKGYPKIPLNIIDEKLSKLYKDYQQPSVESVTPRSVGELLGVDAVLYVTLKECDTSFVLLYATTSVSATFDLRSARTNDSLWSTKYSVAERNFEITRERLRMQSCQAFEPAMQEILDKVMETLPQGPDG